MYCLNRHNQLPLLSAPDGEANRARQYANTLLADSTEGLIFIPDQHKYFLHGKYTLQQNLYRIQLENIGIYIGSMELIWLKDNGSYENVKIDEYDTLIRYAMNLHKES